jgi:DNA-binding transcriptional LysR family regulator
VGFVRRPVSDGRLTMRPVLDERLVAALGPHSPWAPRAGLRSVAGEPFVIIARSRSASFYDHAISVCAAAGFAPRIVQEASELFTVLSLVRAGLGVSLVPRSAALMRLPGVRFRELSSQKAAWNIAVAWHRDASASPLVRRFVEMVPAAVERRTRSSG